MSSGIVNTIMEQFYIHLTAHAKKHGFDAPKDLLLYLTELLGKRVNRTAIIPDPSFGERYLTLLSQGNYPELLDYADTCLFFTSLMPEYGIRRGLSMDYYASLGISSYYTAGDYFVDDRYIQLGNWFYPIQKFLYSAIHPSTGFNISGYDF